MGIPHNFVPFPREPRNISFQPRGIPTGSAGFPIPIPVQVSTMSASLL